MRSSEIGGQAVIEGVMMKNKDKYAVAVRKPDGSIIVDVKKTGTERTGILKAPIIRGVVAFIDSMVVGIRTLSYSASFFDDEEDEKTSRNKETKKDTNTLTKTEAVQEEQNQQKTEEIKDVQDQKKTEPDTGDKLLIAGTVAFSIVLSVAIFMLLPMFLSKLLGKVIENQFLLVLIEGLLRIFIFVGYVVAISQMKDIKRVFSYHGAEHKTINCVEHGLDLTVENVRGQARLHKRCGTSFMFFVIFISLIFFLFIRVDQIWLQALIRVLLVPVIAGISYELIRLAGRSDSGFVAVISKPGFLLQNLTTREPDDSMIEVAIASVEAVFDWRPFVEQVREENMKQNTINIKASAAKKDSSERPVSANAINAAAEPADIEAKTENLPAAEPSTDDTVAARAEQSTDDTAAARAEQPMKDTAAVVSEEQQINIVSRRNEAEENRKKEKEAAAARKKEERAEAEARRQAEHEAAIAKRREEKEAAEERKAAEEKKAAERLAEEEKLKEAAEKEAARIKAEKEVNLDSLDKELKVGKGKKLTFKDPLRDQEAPKLVEPEENDEILLALDKFFVFEDKDD